MEELKRTIAMLFKRKGRSELSEKEFVFSASMDLRWFPPKDAQKLLDVAASRGVVSVSDGKIAPTFDITTVDMPLDFTPSSSVLDLPEKEDTFSKMLDYVLTNLDLERKDVISRINAIQGEMEIEIEVAALLAGAEWGLDMSRFNKEIEKDIIDRMKSGS